ncbi:MAG: amidase family protein [Sporolactobacillus sp.]|jgi:amidase|nr:amidase family protein [Sporolactobacillus sp.]
MSKKKRFALFAGLAGAAAAGVTTVMYLHQELAGKKPFTIEEATLADIQRALKSGRTTAKKLVRHYLKRIDRYDCRGPRLNAILELNPGALQEAEASDIRRSVQPASEPLLGVPIIVQDNINTAAPLHTTAGSPALANHQPARDAFLVGQLRKAGAIILAKANLTEWANFISDRMPNGYSSLGGQTTNPYGPFDVGGSSSGTAVAVAANLAAVGVGTETSGSILKSCSANALVGIKPTVGLISRSGIIPIAHSQDTPGPIARTVADAARLLNILTGVDKADEETIWSSSDMKKDYTVYLKRSGLRGARLGIDRRYLREINDEKIAIIEQSLKLMDGKGAQLVDPAAIPSWDKLKDKTSSVLFREFKWDVNHYLADLPPASPVHSLADLITFNQKHAVQALKYGQTIFEKAQRLSSNLGERQYLADRADDIRLSRKEGIDAVMKGRHLDALLFAGASGAELAAKAGYPSITVPAGFTSEGEPIGLTFTGQAFSEPRLIELAYSFEQASRRRKAPHLG